MDGSSRGLTGEDLERGDSVLKRGGIKWFQHFIGSQRCYWMYYWDSLLGLLCDWVVGCWGVSGRPFAGHRSLGLHGANMQDPMGLLHQVAQWVRHLAPLLLDN